MAGQGLEAASPRVSEDTANRNGSPAPDVIHGLPKLGLRDLAYLTGDGDVVVASGCTVTCHNVTKRACEAAWSADLGEPVTAIADSAAGVLAAAGGCVHRLMYGKPRVLARLDGDVRSLAAAGGSVFAAVAPSGRLDGSLVEIDANYGFIASERPLRVADVALSTDSTQSFLAVSDGATVQTLSTRATDPCAGQAPVPAAHEPRPEQSPCACGEKHHPCDCRCDAASGPAPPDREHPHGSAPDPCDPGGSGVPTPSGGRVIGDDGGVSQHPPGTGHGVDPCRTQLFFSVRQLRAAAGHYVAADLEGRHMAMLASDDLTVLQERHVRHGALLLTHPMLPTLLTFDRATGVWTRDRLHEISKDALAVGPVVEAETMTFVGQPMQVMGYGRKPVDKLSILVLPMLDPTQAFNNADLPKFAAYYKRAGFDHVREYYAENTFGALTDIAFDVFGVHTGPALGPLRLPKPITGYYYPTYVGAHVELVKTGVDSSFGPVFDGRERMTLNVKPTAGGRPASTVTLEFYAALFFKLHGNFPVQIRFDGTETATISLKQPGGVPATLKLAFTAKTVDIANEGELAAKLKELETYLDGVIAAAEAAAGITSRLFAKPVMRRLEQPSPGVGYLVTTLFHAVGTGPKLELTAISVPAGSNPLGVGGGYVGRIQRSQLAGYLDWIATLAQEKAGFNYTQRRLADDPVVAADGTNLVSSFFISPVDGGPGATMAVSNVVEMGELFDTSKAIPNNDVTADLSDAPREVDAIIDDSFSAAVERMAPPNQHAQNKDSINAFFGKYNGVIIGLIGPAKTDPIDPEFVQPHEMWSAGPNSHEGRMRAVDAPRTASYRPFKDIQMATTWNFVFFEVKPDYASFCHELGHALGFADLYGKANYRDDLAYFDSWAMMANHGGKPHHAGYNKLQAGWIPEARVHRITPPGAGQVLTEDVLLVPIEYWRKNDALIGAARNAFNAPQLPVVQLVQLDLGGDADVFDLIEARQRGLAFSQELPAAPAVLISNCIVWWDEKRYAFNGKYRAMAHLLNDPAGLSKAGDSFDLAKAPELAAKGIVVNVVDRKSVDGVEVFRISVRRENSAYIDLYFDSADPYYRNPDLWIDWTGDNGPGAKSSSADPKDHRSYPIGQPVDQGEAIRVPDHGNELHWMVARVRNRGGVKAEKVKLNFSICEPPGGGDHGNFKLASSVTLDEVPPGNKPVDGPGEWRVPAGFKGHTCVLVEIADYKIPRDSDAVALASDDVWQANNRAQKNVDQILPKSNSPYEAIEFDFSVNNSGLSPEIAYLEPEGLSNGARLTIGPRRRTIPVGQTVLFRCKLELDDRVIDASCKSDRDFRIVVWRVDEHTAVRWGGVQYKVRPRKRTNTDLTAGWAYSNDVDLSGHVSPDPGGGQVRIRLAYEGEEARWVTAPLQPGGTFSYATRAPANSRSLKTVALFEGNLQWSESRSPERSVEAPPPLR